MKWMIGTTLGLMALSFSLSAQAVDTSIIRAQMTSGQYAKAYELAEASETAEGLALAAEILLSEVMLGDADNNKTQSKRARDLAEAALELDPTHQNARLQYAIADGFVTRETGDVTAWMKKLPQKTLAVVQAYRRDYPDDVRGDALMGAWHLAIVRKAGEKNAHKWFGANIKDGQAFYDKAIAFEPDNTVIGVNYAFGLIALDEDDMPDVVKARGILEHLSKTEPEDHLGHTVLDYGQKALIRLEDRKAAQDYTGDFLDGKKPE